MDVCGVCCVVFSYVFFYLFVCFFLAIVLILLGLEIHPPNKNELSFFHPYPCDGFWYN